METLSGLLTLSRRPSPHPRDSQRQKLYNAERVLHGGRSFKTNGECQAFIDSVLQERWFQSRWPVRTVKVQVKSYGNATGDPFRQQINLPTWARCERILIHELAHVIAPVHVAWHGPEYCAVYLTLVEFVFGKAAAADLRASFVKHKVKYRAGMKAVPEPTRKVPTQAEVRAKRQARESAPLSGMEKQQAAAILRRAIKLNMLGTTGTKQRAYALAIARTLEGA